MSTQRFKRFDPVKLLERLDIQFVAKGDVLWASCPNPAHNDKTPSWRFIANADSERFGQHRCYGCGFGGWPVRLVEAVLGCSREEAREWLHDIDVAPPLPFKVSIEVKQGLKARIRIPPGVYFEPLSEWPDAARSYLLGDRGVTPWQVARWGMGYTKGRYDALTNPLAGRIFIPVLNTKGELISYTARSYLPNSKRRYKEPSMGEGADLGAVFGEQHWPKNRWVVVVTEGAFDALAVERVFMGMGLPVAGIYGSQLHSGHVARISTFRGVVLATDPDKAGNRVAGELTEQLRRWTQVVRAELPEGQDCASLPRAELKRIVQSSLDALCADRDRRDLQAGRTAGYR